MDEGSTFKFTGLLVPRELFSLVSMCRKIVDGAESVCLVQPVSPARKRRLDQKNPAPRMHPQLNKAGLQAVKSNFHGQLLLFNVHVLFILAPAICLQLLTARSSSQKYRAGA